jgi:hypothetical protein
MILVVLPTPEMQTIDNPGKFTLLYCVSTKLAPAFKSCDALGALSTAGAETIGVNTSS